MTYWCTTRGDWLYVITGIWHTGVQHGGTGGIPPSSPRGFFTGGTLSPPLTGGDAHSWAETKILRILWNERQFHLCRFFWFFWNFDHSILKNCFKLYGSLLYVDNILWYFNSSDRLFVDFFDWCSPRKMIECVTGTWKLNILMGALRFTSRSGFSNFVGLSFVILLLSIGIFIMRSVTLTICSSAICLRKLGMAPNDLFYPIYLLLA